MALTAAQIEKRAEIKGKVDQAKSKLRGLSAETLRITIISLHKTQSEYEIGSDDFFVIANAKTWTMEVYEEKAGEAAVDLLMDELSL